MFEGKKIIWLHSGGNYNDFVSGMIQKTGVETLNPIRVNLSSYFGKAALASAIVFGFGVNRVFDFHGFDPALYDYIFFKKNRAITGYVRCLLKKKTGHALFIGWNENPETERIYRLTLNDKRVIYSCFDPDDAKKYGFFYNNSFLFRDLNDSLPTCEKKYDVIFIGHDKGRSADVEKIFSSLSLSGLKTKAFFPSEKASLPYAQYLTLIKESRAVLDITQQGQKSPTLRTLEGSLIGTKVVTDNSAALRQSFYKTSNILYFSSAKDLAPSKVKSFLSWPFESPSIDEIGNYDFSLWIKRFFSFERP